ncbi:MAG: hypothetical protein EAZ85_16260, partial [Bacteroidetes bacterium]
MKKYFFIFLFFCHQLEAQKIDKEPTPDVLLGKFTGHLAKITAVDVSPTGKFGISGDAMGSIKVWNLIKKELIYENSLHKRAISSVKFSADGKQFLTASLDGFVRVFDIDLKKEIAFLNLKDEVKQADFTALQDIIFAHTGGYRYTKWNIKRNEQVKSDYFAYKIKFLEISKKSAHMMIATEINSIRYWNYGLDMQLFLDTQVHRHSISTLTMNKNSTFGASTSSNYLILWDLKANLPKRYNLQSDQISSTLFNNSSEIIIVFNHSLLVCYNFEQLKITKSFTLPEKSEVLASDSRGSLLLVGSELGNVFLYSTDDNIFKENIDNYIQECLEKWYEKDIYEKTNDYVVRVKEANIQAKTDSLIKVYFGNSFADFLPKWKNFKQSYNADKEEFDVTFENFRKIYFKIPVSEAKNFDFTQCEVKNP